MLPKAQLMEQAPGVHRGWRFPGLAVIVAALFLSGVLVVLYPSTASWLNQYQQSEVLEGYSGELEQLPQSGLTEALARAAEYNAQLTGGALVGSYRNIPDASGVDSAPLGYSDQLSADESGLMARIKIPAIAVDLPIYHGTSDDVLLRGVGHLEGTALPIGGDGTHSVLTAHRGLAQSPLFTDLNNVQVGDRFVIEVYGEVLTYDVIQTQVVEPSETEALYPIANADLVTLVTCTPLGINSQRILVTGERVSPTPVADVADLGEPPEIPGFPTWAVILGGAIMVLAAYIWLMGRPPRSRGRHEG